MSQWLQLLVLTVLGKLHRVLWHPPTQPSNTGRHPNCFLVHLCSKLCFCLAVLQAVSRSLVNPHQRCLYSDSPFARIDTFLYCRVQKWVGGSDLGLSKPQNHKKIIPNHFKKVHPKVQNPKMGLPITSHPSWSGPFPLLSGPIQFLRYFTNMSKTTWSLAPAGAFYSSSDSEANSKTLSCMQCQFEQFLGGCRAHVRMAATLNLHRANCHAGMQKKNIHIRLKGAWRHL